MRSIKLIVLTGQKMFIILLCNNFVFAQNGYQTVRGTVVDKVSQTPLPGVVVQVLNSNPVISASTDANGMFKLNNVAIGKQNLKINFIGYKELIQPNVVVNAGKEVVLNIGLDENMILSGEVVVSTKFEKNRPLNNLSAVSTRAFSVEETQRFAAAINDPARMATSFAGVVQTGDGNNAISIRGNSPNGLLWRMEGVEIPNPNHFSNVGTSGGGVSILSAQLLTNSDFSTGAFAAEYGNALSGVFDLKLRKGNNEKREYTLQAGIMGMDLSTEGPFKKGYGGAYVVNYRYSTLDILSRIGVPIFGDASTTYQDLTFNISLPTKKTGSFSIFGFGGLSAQTRNAKKDSLKWKKDSKTQLNDRFMSNTGAVGLTHTQLLKNRAYVKTALVASGTQTGDAGGKLDSTYAIIKQDKYVYTQNKVTLSSTYTQKLSPRSNIRTGVILNQLFYNLNYQDSKDTNMLISKIDVKGNTQSAQAFFQWNYQLAPKLTTNLGLHYYQLLLNNSHSLEPRASLKYDLSSKENVSFGYGLHSQLQPMGVYFARKNYPDGGYTQPNKDLGLSKAHHFVAGYDRNLSAFSHIKLETYYQYLFNVPISTDQTNTYSILNSTDGYTNNQLVNTGHGKNYGAELTYERFMYKNFYYLLSASLYNSKYQASNGTWYNTRFNTNYVTSFTIGKEWALSEKRKNRIIGLNLKSIFMGGMRYTPVDLAASTKAGSTVGQNDKAFENQAPDYYRIDIRISCKRNYKGLTSTLALDIQNVTNHLNIAGQHYDPGTKNITYYYQTGLIPVISYKVEF